MQNNNDICSSSSATDRYVHMCMHPGYNSSHQPANDNANACKTTVIFSRAENGYPNSVVKQFIVKKCDSASDTRPKKVNRPGIRWPLSKQLCIRMRRLDNNTSRCFRVLQIGRACVCVLSAQLFKLMGDDVSPTHFANDSKWAHVLPKSDTTHVRPYQHINSSCWVPKAWIAT